MITTGSGSIPDPEPNPLVRAASIRAVPSVGIMVLELVNVYISVPGIEMLERDCSVI